MKAHQRFFTLRLFKKIFFAHFSDPPRINGSGFPTEVSVVVNNVLELVCEAEGIPAPTLTWVKDGRPLPQTNSLSVLRGGEVLRIASVQVSRYY